MKRIGRTVLVVNTACALLLASAPAQSPAVVPLAVGLGKEIMQNLIFGEVKGHLIDSMAGMGCKGSTLAGMLANVDISHGPAVTSNMHMPSGMPGGATPQPATMGPPPQNGVISFFNSLGDKVKSAFGGGHSAPSAQSHPAVAEAERVTGHPVHQVSGNLAVADAPPDMASAFTIAQREVGAGLAKSPMGSPPEAKEMTQMDPEQMKQVTASMGQMQDAMSKPLSRPETLAVFDELAQLGVLTPSMHSEVRDCIKLASPSASQSLGQTGAIFKSMVLPQLKTTKAQLAALPPESQQQLIDEITQSLKEANADDRKAFFDGLGQGYFPQSVVDGVKAKF
jgi:hypothetical protein